MERREELIKQCRYYKGEKVFPPKLSSMDRGYLFWLSEAMWVDEGDTLDRSSVVLMTNCGLVDEQLWAKGISAKITDIPFNLRCCMFELYCKIADADPITLADDFVRILYEYLGFKKV